jgi:hypothetical protein
MVLGPGIWRGSDRHPKFCRGGRGQDAISDIAWPNVTEFG